MSGRDWPWATLDEVATVTAGNPAPQGAEFFEGGSRPFVRVQDLGRLEGAANVIDTADLVNDRAAATLKLFPKGSVLFTKSGASLLLNQRAILGKDMHVVSHIGVAVPGPRITSEWLYYWLRTVDFADIAHGANMPSLPLARVKQVRLPVPPVTEQQRRVAEIEKQFSRLDEAVANLKRVLTRLTAYRERALEDAFASEPNRTIGELISEGPQNGLYLPKDAYGSGTPIVRIDDYQTDWLRPVTELRRVRATDYQVSIWALHPGDLLVNRVNSMSHLGKCIVIPDALARALFESNMMRIRFVAEVVPRYIELYLGSRIGKQRLTANAKWAVNQASINQKDVRATAIPLPSRKRQAQIVAELDRRLSIVREVEAEVNANLGRANGLRGAVLARAFSVTAK